MHEHKRVGEHTLNLDWLEGITRFPSFYEPFLRGKDHMLYGEPIVDLSSDIFDISEKVDGTSIGIGVCESSNGDWFFVRSRKEIIAVSTDFNFQDKDNIIAEKWRDFMLFALGVAPELRIRDYPLIIYYGEWYGIGIQKRGKSYSYKNNFRLFGKRAFTHEAITQFIEAGRDNRGSLRGKMSIVPIEHITKPTHGLDCVPQLGEVSGAVFSSIENTVAWLEQFKESQIKEGGTDKARSEGVVLWPKLDYNYMSSDYKHPDQGTVAKLFKLKFDDYAAFRRR